MTFGEQGATHGRMFENEQLLLSSVASPPHFSMADVDAIGVFPRRMHQISKISAETMCREKAHLHHLAVEEAKMAAAAEVGATMTAEK